MDIEIDRVVDLVALLKGEFSDWRLRCDAGCEGSDLRQMVQALVEPIAVKLTLEAPLERFSSPLDIRSDIYGQADWGDMEDCGVYDLPKNFLRLHSLRMADWPCTLSDEKRGDAQRLALGDVAPEWMRRRPRRPWVLLDRVGELTRMTFGGTQRRMPAQAAYIPRPRYEEEEGWLYDIDPALLPDLARCIGDKL